MSVRVIAFSQLQLTDPHDRADSCLTAGHIEAFAYRGFEQSTRGLADHDRVYLHGRVELIGGRCYAPTERTRQHEVLDMSSGGYGDWRALLSQTVLGVDPGTVWRDPDSWRDRPFFEVVEFADNEGCIGPDAARDLLADFQVPEHREAWERAVTGHDDERWYAPTWDSWITGLTLAVDGGLVMYR